MRKINKKGFTLIEVLVVIAIIGTLATITVASVKSAREKAKIAKAQSEIDTLYKTFSQLMIDTGEWPGHQTAEEINQGNGNEIWDLSTPAAGLVATDGNYFGWQGPYLVSIPTDAWGNDYFFDTDYYINEDDEPCAGGSSCQVVAVIGSFGPDGVGPNQYNTDDIIKVLR